MAEKSSFVFDVTASEFPSAVLERSKKTPVVVDFWAPWCGPCRTLGPVLERLVNRREGDVLLAKVNTDDEQRLALKYGISSLPTVVAFQNGQPTLHFMGAIPEAQIVAFLDQLVPSSGDKQAFAAKELESTDPAKAEAIYRQILAADAKHEPSILGLVRILIVQGKDGEASELLDRISIGGQDVQEIGRLGALLELRKSASELGSEPDLRARVSQNPKDALARYELGCRLAEAGKYVEALETLLAAGELDAALASGKVREAMVKIFEIVGAGSPLANDYRNKLSLLLY